MHNAQLFIHGVHSCSACLGDDIIIQESVLSRFLQTGYRFCCRKGFNIPIWYNFHDLRPVNRAGPILTAPEPARSWPWKSENCESSKNKKNGNIQYKVYITESDYHENVNTGSNGSGKALVCRLNQQLGLVRDGTNKQRFIEVAVEAAVIRRYVNCITS